MVGRSGTGARRRRDALCRERRRGPRHPAADPQTSTLARAVDLPTVPPGPPL